MFDIHYTDQQSVLELTERLTRKQKYDSFETRLIKQIISDLQARIYTLKLELEPRVNDALASRACREATISKLLSTDLRKRSSAGFDDTYSQFNALLSTMIKGENSIEFESNIPYAHSFRDSQSNAMNFDISSLANADRTGILLYQIFKQLSKTARADMRIVALIDEFSTFGGKDFTHEERVQYTAFIGKILHDNQVIGSAERPGVDYIIIPESSMQHTQPDLIRALAHSLRGRVEKRASAQGEIVTFIPHKDIVQRLRVSKARRKSLLRTGISLSINGTPTCQALDAASFLAAHNKHIVHMVVLDKSLRTQQDETYTLLVALDIVDQYNYHNVFFDPELPPAVVAFTLLHRLKEELETISATLDKQPLI